MITGLTSNCHLELYINPQSVTATRALDNLSRLCRKELRGEYPVRVINILESPALAEAAGVSWTPTLLRRTPEPVRRVIGDLSSASMVLAALDMPAAATETTPQAVPSQPTESRAAALPQKGPGDASPFATVLRHSPDGTLVVDAFGRLVYQNPAAQRLLGRSYDQLLARLVELPAEASPSQGPLHVRVGARVLEAHGRTVEWEGCASQLVTLREVTERVLARERAQALAHELLTPPGRGAIKDKTALRRALAKELACSLRAGTRLSALLIEPAPEARGQLNAAQARRALSTVAAFGLRPHDVLGAIDDMRFIVLLPDTEPAAASQVAGRLIRELTQKLGGALTSGLRVRSGLWPAQTGGLDDVLRASVDSAELFTAVPFAQAQGSLSEPTVQVTARRIVNMVDGSSRGSQLHAECPQARRPTSGDLLGGAAHQGMTGALDLLRARASLRATAQAPGPRHHIDVLPSTLTQPTRHELVRLVKERTAPSSLCIEVSEKEMVGGPEPLLHSRNALKQLGVAFAIDHSRFNRQTLEALLVLKPEVTKLDGTLVAGVSRRHGQARDIRRLLAVAESLGVEVIAQEVESAEDADALVALGVTSGQGRLWEQPALGSA